jgi:type IV secretion system protein VirB9
MKRVGVTGAIVCASVIGIFAGGAGSHVASAAGLTRTEARGTALSGQWRNGVGIVTRGPDGKIIYLFGQSQPTIVCAPLQVCELELQAGETVRDVLVGDTVRWTITAASSGSETGQRIHLIIKPHVAGLETSMVITTSRRTYSIKLKSDATEYMARVAFSYPEDGIVQTASFRQINSDIDARSGFDRRPENLSFKYDIAGNARWRPTRVYTDGIKTYIQFSAAMGSGDAPVLYVVTGGENRIVNYRLKGSVMIVDYVFDRAILLSGVGWGQEKVTIDRRG